MRLNQLRETRINERGAALTKNEGNLKTNGFILNVKQFEMFAVLFC